MTDAEFNQRLDRIAELAKKQREGPYTVESNSMQALDLIETLALLLIENHDFKYGKPPIGGR